MAGTFGRRRGRGRSRSRSIRFQSGVKGVKSREREKPNRKKSSQSKAGTGKAEAGSESGSSEELSSASSESKPNTEPSSRSGGERANLPRPISSTVATTQPSPEPVLCWIRFRPTSAAAVAGGETPVLSVFTFSGAKRRTCAGQNGGEPRTPQDDVVTVWPEARWRRRDCRGAGRPHCPVHRPERPTQQGMHGEGAEGPASSPFRAHSDSVLRCAGPARLRPAQQSGRLAHKKAKSAIDELAELPAWNPTSGSIANADFQQNPAQNQDEEQNSNQNHQEEQNPSQNHQIGSLHGLGDAIGGPSSSVSRCDVQNNSGEFLQQALDSDAIADTIKSFFPMGGAASAAQETNSPAMHFQNFQSPPDLLSRAQSQDLRLSLQSFQDPMLLHHHQPPQHHQTEPALFPGTAALGFDAPSGGWSDHQRMVAWNTAGDSGTGGGAFVFSSPATTPFLQPLFGQNQFLSQRGPLQSSYTQPIRAWIDPSTIAAATTAADHHHQSLPFHASSLPSINFAASFSGFSGFHIPARIQGEQEEHDGISDKPSSASSDSRH